MIVFIWSQADRGVEIPEPALKLAVGLVLRMRTPGSGAGLVPRFLGEGLEVQVVLLGSFLPQPTVPPPGRAFECYDLINPQKSEWTQDMINTSMQLVLIKKTAEEK